MYVGNEDRIQNRRRVNEGKVQYFYFAVYSRTTLLSLTVSNMGFWHYMNIDTVNKGEVQNYYL